MLRALAVVYGRLTAASGVERIETNIFSGVVKQVISTKLVDGSMQFECDTYSDASLWTAFEECDDILPEGFIKSFVNNRYQVHIKAARNPFADWNLCPPLVWLSIRNRENTPINDWRDMQRIKNDLCGTTCDAVQIYPQESRLVDTSNQFHLWVFPPSWVFPVGYPSRDVFKTQKEVQEIAPNAKQRDFAPHHHADDCPEVGIAWELVKGAKGV